MSTNPKFTYYFKPGQFMFRTKLSDASTIKYSLSFVIRKGISWCEGPVDQLYCIGGDRSNQANRIDVSRDFSVTTLPCLNVSRIWHATTYHEGYIYVIGGGIHEMRSCERFSSKLSYWERIEDLPHRACYSGVVGLKSANSLYAFGGFDQGKAVKVIQKLCLNSLNWSLLPVKMPEYQAGFACFKVSEDYVFIMGAKSLWKFTPEMGIERVKRVPYPRIVNSGGPNYFCNGVLFCSRPYCPIRRLIIGNKLTSF